LDALWNDDFHHSAKVALTGHNEAYYTDYLGNPQELICAAKWGFLYQGQRSSWQKKRRGSPALDLPPAHFVTFLENHDQVANSGLGERIHRLTSPGRYKAMTALLLLGPATPMLFQGQEFAASAPFLFFADHNPDLAKLVRQGRRKFLRQFPTLALPETQAGLANPDDLKTFERCRLDWSERERHRAIVALHQDLLKLRREDAVFRAQRLRGVDGAVLAPQALVLRYFGENGADRLLIVNLGRDLHFSPAPEPLLAPPTGRRWQLLWSSNDARYGRNGNPPPEGESGWRIPGEAAIVLLPTIDDGRHADDREQTSTDETEARGQKGD
jgi:maltooligosyltrehalose trehalohydrolase